MGQHFPLFPTITPRNVESRKNILEKLRQHCIEKRFRVQWQEKITEHQRAQTFPGKNWTAFYPDVCARKHRNSQGRMSTKALGEKSSGEKLDSISPTFLQKKNKLQCRMPAKHFWAKIWTEYPPPPPKNKNLQCRMPTKISWVNFGARTSESNACKMFWGKNLDSKNLQSWMPIKMSWVKFGQHFPLNTKSPESNAFKTFWGKHLDSKKHPESNAFKSFHQSRMPTKISWNFLEKCGQHFPIFRKIRVECLWIFWGNNLDSISPFFFSKKKISRIECPQKSRVNFGKHFPIFWQKKPSRAPATFFGAKIWTAFPP